MARLIVCKWRRKDCFSTIADLPLDNFSCLTWGITIILDPPSSMKQLAGRRRPRACVRDTVLTKWDHQELEAQIIYHIFLQ